MTTRIVIGNGPSKFALMNALFDEMPRYITFVLTNKATDEKGNQIDPTRIMEQEFAIRNNSSAGVMEFPTPTIHISEVGKEDGSGERWLFKGSCRTNTGHAKVNGYFSTKDRTGWIEFW